MSAQRPFLLVVAALVTLGCPARAQQPAPMPSHPLLVDEMNREIDKRLSATGTDPGKALQMFSSSDDSGFVYVRNPAWWGHGLDMTGVVATHDYVCQGNYLTSGGALLTPQDVVCAAHFAHPIGAVLNFVDAHNVVQKAKVVATAGVAGTDIWLCHLAAPMTGIKAYKVLPPNYGAYGADGELSHWPLLLAYNFGHFGYVLDGDRLSGEFLFHPCLEPERAPYTTRITSGSGSPAFAIINDEPILVGCLHTSASISWLAGHEEAINAALAGLHSPYKLTPIDLTAPVAYMLF